MSGRGAPAAVVLGVVLACLPAGAAAQAAAPDTVIVPAGPTPAGAMLRSALVPGWGQGAVGAHTRGAVYFAVHGVNVFMLLKTGAKLGEVRAIADRRRAAVRDSVTTANPELRGEELDSLQAQVLEGDAPLGRFRGLERSREQQREDWLVWGGFWLLASAVDAYVAAQLADFPADVVVRPGAGRALEVGVRVPAGR